MSNVSKVKENLRKNQNEMLEGKKNTVTEMKHAFDGLFSEVDTAEKFFWTGGSINRIVKNQKQSEQKLKAKKKKTEYSQIVKQITKGIIHIKWEY